MPHPEIVKSPTLSRRGLLSAVSAMSVLGLTHIPGRAFAATIDLDGFLALSASLTGKKDLSEDIAGRMLKAFAKTGREDEIAALDAEDADSEIADEIVEAWYTGVSPDPDDLDVLTYLDALIWRAMDYTKPMAVCGGGVGYWAEPPRT